MLEAALKIDLIDIFVLLVEIQVNKEFCIITI